MNPDLVTNIKPCTSQNETITVVTNGGRQLFEHIGTLNLLPLDVHFNAFSMANILYLKDVADLPNVKITMDTTVERAIIVEYKDLYI